MRGSWATTLALASAAPLLQLDVQHTLAANSTHVHEDEHGGAAFDTYTLAAHANGTQHVDAQNLEDCNPWEGCRVMLLTMCESFHGTTAIQQLLMSGGGVATLCSGKSWECEGGRILCAGAEDPSLGCSHPFADTRRWFLTGNEDYDEALDGPGKDGWDYGVALDVWSKYWDLSKPVLLEKTPENWHHMEAMFMGIPNVQLSQLPWPNRFLEFGISQLKPKIILMWTPYCITYLSSNVRDAERQLGFDEWARRELRMAHMLAVKHWKLTRGPYNAQVLVINYGDLLWDTSRTISRIKAFEPSVGSLNAYYVPQESSHGPVYPENQWKVRGSIAAFGDVERPESLGYNQATKQCYGATGRGYGRDAFQSGYAQGGGIPDDELERGRRAYDYLLQLS